jgi:hypothetical protein
MEKGGLRSAGVASLTVDMLSDALLREGIGEVNTGRQGLCRIDLEALSETWTARESSLREIYSLRERGRKQVSVHVTEKNSKTREVWISIDFFISNLNFVWEERARFVARSAIATRHRRRGGALFISNKTGRQLGRKSIANFLGVAFKKAGVPGSGHRLRAFFAENVLRAEWNRAKSKGIKSPDILTILFAVAERLGHRNIRTLRHYLNKLKRIDDGLDLVTDIDTHHEYTLRAALAEFFPGNEALSDRLVDLVRELAATQPDPVTKMP